MKLSVITICYNEPDIEKTCKSVVSQVFQDFEWIVVDGGSNKETIDILNKYKNRINVFISEKDDGVYNAMNKGIKAACGEYLNFLNGGDCYFDENSLKNALGYFNAADILYGDAKFLSQGGDFIKSCPDELPFGWLQRDCLPHQASFIKRSLYDKYGLYNEKNKIVSDLEKWIVFIDINKCSYKRIPYKLAVHNYNGISSVMSEVHLKERQDVIKKYYGLNDDEVKIKKNIKFFGIPIMKIVEKKYKTYYYLLGFFPILKKVRE